MGDLLSIALSIGFAVLRFFVVLFLVPVFILFPGRRENETHWGAVGRRVVDTLQWTFIV